MKILITGSNGLLGQKLVNQLASNPDIELMATGRGANRNPEGNYNYTSLDITEKEQVERVITGFSPDIIINTAAMTQVDQCETEPEECWKLNVTAVEHLVEASEKTESFFIHLSTDFVFDGEDGPYAEEDQPNPLSHYAESKLASEAVLKKSSIRWAIVRTMLVYGIAHDMSRSNIILWVKKSLEQKKHIRVVNDQWRMPTLAEDLAEGCMMIARQQAEGVFHISGKDLLTPYDIAVKTADYFNLDKKLIQEVDGSVFTQKAKRPAKTGFVLNKAKEVLGYEPVSFQEGLKILDQQLSFLN